MESHWAHIGHAICEARLDMAFELHEYWCAILGLNQCGRPRAPAQLARPELGRAQPVPPGDRRPKALVLAPGH